MRYNPISDSVYEYMIANNCTEIEARLAIRKRLQAIAIEARERLKTIEVEKLNRMYHYKEIKHSAGDFQGINDVADPRD